MLREVKLTTSENLPDDYELHILTGFDLIRCHILILLIFPYRLIYSGS